MRDNGDILIANTSAGKVELVSGSIITTVLKSFNPDGSLNIFSDLTITDGGTVLVLDGEWKRRIISLNPDTGATPEVARAPDLEGDAFLNISSVSERGGKLLIAARPAIQVSQTQAKGVGDSQLFLVSTGKWTPIVSGADVGVPGGVFRDAVFTDEGGYAALADNYFVVIGSDGSHRKIDLGTHWGGGVIPIMGDWLVGVYTSVRHIRGDFSSMRTVPVDVRLANVGHLSWTPKNTILLSDTDRSIVHELEVSLKDGGLRVLRSIGNQEMSLKIRSIAPSPDGRVLLLDGLTPRILSYDPSTGDVEAVAGTGRQGHDSPKRASEFSFLFPNAMAVAADGSVLVAEANYRIVRVADGEVTVFAGDVQQGTPGDGQDRLDTRFRSLRGLSFDNSRLLVVDQGNHSLYRIRHDGTVETVMGTGTAGEWEEGKPAKGQPLNFPYAVLARKNGTILVADSYNNVVVEIGADGIARRFAGQIKFTVYQGLGAHSGDGGQARDAELNTPRGLSEDNDGNVYITDQFNHAIRRVASDGVITNVAGGIFGYDGTPSRLSYPLGAIRIGDHLYVADTGNSVTWAIPVKKIDQ